MARETHWNSRTARARHRSTPGALGIVVILGASLGSRAVGSAQEPRTEFVAPSDPGSANTTAPALEAAPTTPSPAEPGRLASAENPVTTASPTPGACLVDMPIGVSQSDAFLTARLVCMRLRERGVAVRGPSWASDEGAPGFHVEVGRLGAVAILTVRRSGTATRPGDSRTLRMSTLEDAIVGAPRVVDALLDSRPVEATATVETLTHQETRRPALVPTRTDWGLGLDGYSAVGSSLAFGYGADFLLEHTTPSLAFGARAHVSGGDTRLYSLTIGARKYLSNQEVAPFVAAGVGLYSLRVDVTGAENFYRESGLGGHIDAGLEMMRFADARMGVLARAELPFFLVKSGHEETFLGEDGLAHAIRPKERYYAPIGLSIYYLWN